ncbi:hypothetical protein EKO04_008408 [Ascochyta lentis]|uniref:Blue (type 1) copper domain-containing protein n=1 Tax=Ascochyta lentis TaxID=205686 RepID=A0A8H7J0T8_9PLEO|nr:hypothetical protein EKO04_008408 [Ascochyta lentis]
MYRSIALIFVALASATVHTVKVGSTGLAFDPQTISAAPGDTVVFELFPGHNVVEGDFDRPCQTDDDDFYSGPYSETNSGERKFVVNVTSDDPVYYFCGTPGHCQGGMVGGINVPTSGNETIDAYSQAAVGAQPAQVPNQPRGGQLLNDAQIASLTSGGVASSASASVSASAAASASTTNTSARSGAASPTASAATASATAGAGHSYVGQINGLAALALGAAAWLA